MAVSSDLTENREEYVALCGEDAVREPEISLNAVLLQLISPRARRAFTAGRSRRRRSRRSLRTATTWTSWRSMPCSTGSRGTAIRLTQEDYRSAYLLLLNEQMADGTLFAVGALGRTHRCKSNLPRCGESLLAASEAGAGRAAGTEGGIGVDIMSAPKAAGPAAVGVQVPGGLKTAEGQALEQEYLGDDDRSWRWS